MDDKLLKRILKRGVADIIVEEEFIKLLKSGEPIRLKQGFDPSRPDIHLGHVVGLKKLRQLQDIGHKVILIVGDWTAQIGDPSGASTTRTMLTAEEVKANAQTYMKHFFKVVDPDKTEVRWQSEWFGKFNLANVIELTSKFTVAQFLARDDFRKRFEEQKPIAITELLYPLLQAYDSVEIKADVEFGGTDQMFNCLVGRELQQMVGQRPQQVFLMPILAGTDGKQKMSKSLNNYIAVDEPPNDMYGKIMSLPDELMMDYFELITDVDEDELDDFRKQLADKSFNPMELKKRLAFEIVHQFHNINAAQTSGDHFTQVFQNKELPDQIEEARVSFKELEAIAGRAIAIPNMLQKIGLVESKSESRRLLSQGAVQIDGVKVTDNEAVIKDGSIIKAGKRRIRKIVNSD
ncbi:tyrosine--tRNA ligase [Chloroflexota bacterium]